MSRDSQDSFEAFYRRYFNRVVAYALRRADRDRALEATAEAFVVAWRRYGELPTDPLPWLLGVARNLLARGYRTEQRHSALVDRLAEGPPPTGRDPADAVTGAHTIRAALARLADTDRELLMLLAWDGLTPKQAAASLGCTLATVNVRLHRARRRLTRELERDTASPPGAGHRQARSMRRVS
jgi:RNA polymerase sigma-70 factor (ECF subfamily)